MNLSTILYTSALTLALSAAAPVAFAASHEKQDSDAYHEMDKKEYMDKKDYKDKKEYKERDGDKATGDYDDGQPDITGAGSETPSAPAHVPGGTNPEDAPDYDRSVE
ncbi:MAG: hypothetical protein R6V43_13325 [Halopseudomonas sp.]